MTILSADYPTLAFHASVTNPFGKGALINLLRQFAKVVARKKILLQLSSYVFVPALHVLLLVLARPPPYLVAVAVAVLVPVPVLVLVLILSLVLVPVPVPVLVLVLVPFPVLFLFLFLFCSCSCSCSCSFSFSCSCSCSCSSSVPVLFPSVHVVLVADVVVGLLSYHNLLLLLFQFVDFFFSSISCFLFPFFFRFVFHFVSLN